MEFLIVAMAKLICSKLFTVNYRFRVQRSPAYALKYEAGPGMGMMKHSHEVSIWLDRHTD